VLVVEQSRRDQEAVLPDGRRVGFAEWGTAATPVIFDFHGGPGCRLIPSGTPEAIEELGVRWITVDRPGLGRSDPQPNRSMADWGRDIGHLADGLGVDTFAVVGWSMGGPYAAATAAVSGSRVTAAALLGPAPVTMSGGDITGLGKTDAWVLARDDPWTMAQLYVAVGQLARRDPAAAVASILFGATGPERAAFEQPDTVAALVDTLVEATRQGSIGLVDDMRVELSPWGFDPAAIGQTVHVWEGTDDSFSLPGVAQAWVDAVPNGVLHTLEGEGHFFPFTHVPQIVDALLR
jgi:pimeloyl-ACP methyl ester carboxylesterase